MMKNSAKAFPFEVFPKDIQQIIDELSKGVQYPKEYVAGAILAALSAGIGNTIVLQKKKKWIEPCVLFMALVGRPGWNKSHPLSFIMDPLVQHDKQKLAEYEREMKRYEEAKMREVSNPKGRDATLALPPKPIRERLLVQDMTIEFLYHLLNECPRGLLLYMDELDAWMRNFLRYGNGSEEQYWLSLWSGKLVLTDRKNGSSSFVPHPFVSVVGTIQMSVLAKAMSGNRSKNGFKDRILFVYPSEKPDCKWNDTEVNEEIVDKWQKLIIKLLQREFRVENGEVIPLVLHLDKDANELLNEWQHGMVDEEDDDEMESLKGKITVYAIRFCLLIHVARWLCGEIKLDTEVDCYTVHRAFLLADYFFETGKRVHDELHDVIIGLDSELKRKLFADLPDVFSTAEGTLVAESLGMPVATFKRFLKNDQLFRREAHGCYSKK